MLIGNLNKSGRGVKRSSHPDSIHKITFTESSHSYIDNFSNQYISVTTFLKDFSPQFNSIKIAKKCSIGDNPKYAGRAPENIMEEWLEEGDRGRTEGTNVHEYAEYLFTKKRQTLPLSKRCSMLFSQVKKTHNSLATRFKFIATETIVFSPALKIAGTIDLLMYDPRTNEIIIIDWKQNKKITTENLYQNFKKPIEHLQETDINKYSLQLSMYQYILESENYYPKIKGYRRALIHLTPKKAIPIKLEYYNYEIKELLKYGKTA